MKKHAGKLQLHRETLLRLGTLQLVGVKGAATDTGPNQLSENYSACPADCETGPVYSGPNYPGCPSYGNWCTFTCG